MKRNSQIELINVATEIGIGIKIQMDINAMHGSRSWAIHPRSDRSIYVGFGG